MNFAKFLRTPFLQNTSGRQLLNLFKSLLKDEDTAVFAKVHGQNLFF